MQTHNQLIDMETLRSRITIEFVLDHFRVQHRHNRCACPVHNGDNPTSFSYTETLFCCHTRGCKGDVVTLFMALSGEEFPQAILQMARLAGISTIEAPPSHSKANHKSRTLANLNELMERPSRRCARLWDIEIEAKIADRDLLIYVHKMFSRQVQRNPDTDLSKFYTDHHCLDSDIDDFDAEIQELRWKKRQEVSLLQEQERKPLFSEEAGS